MRQQRSRLLPFPEEAENAKGPTRVGTLLGHESRLGPTTTAHDEGRNDWASTPSPVARPQGTVPSVRTSYYGCLVLTRGAALFCFLADYI